MYTIFFKFKMVLLFSFLVINSLGGGDTHTNTDVCRQKQF